MNKLLSCMLLTVLFSFPAVLDANEPIPRVTLAPSSTSIQVGNTVQLWATITPLDVINNEGVIWSSSNTTVATVSTSGLVSGISVGDTTITVKTKEGEHTATCVVTVTSMDVGVIKVVLNKSTTSIQTGETEQLFVTLIPPVDIYIPLAWISSNATIATVSDFGLVTGISVGTAIITLKTEDGFTDTCVVTVFNNLDTIKEEEFGVGDENSGSGCNNLNYVMLGFPIIFTILPNIRKKQN